MSDSARKIQINIRNPKKEVVEESSRKETHAPVHLVHSHSPHTETPKAEHKAHGEIKKPVHHTEQPLPSQEKEKPAPVKKEAKEETRVEQKPEPVKHRRHGNIISDLHHRIKKAISVDALAAHSAPVNHVIAPAPESVHVEHFTLEEVPPGEIVEETEVETITPIREFIKEKPTAPVEPVLPPEFSPIVAQELPPGEAEKPVAPRLLIPKKPILLDGITMSSLSVAYFCMEIALENSLPTYAGGLGILAGDMLKSCADLKVPVIGVSLLYRKGFFRQRLDESGWQFEEEEQWDPASKLILLPHEVTVELEGRTVRIHAWLYKLTGISGNIAPIIFLDTDVEGNTEEDRHITDRLYDSDKRWRLLQEAVLGIGGVRMLEKIGVVNLLKYHMNEGHAAFLTLELYKRFETSEDPIEEVRSRAVFTTHTPVAAGHDIFAQVLVSSVLGKEYIPAVVTNAIFEGGTLNMTRLGFYFSHHINGVAKKHGEVTRELFPGYQIESITNGVYAREWTSVPFAKLFDKYLPGWQVDPHSLRYVLSIPLDDLWNAHEEAKKILIDYVNETHQAGMNKEYFTIGFARRAASYKRAGMLFADIDRLMRIADNSKGIQIIFAGKAHPADNEGKLVIQRVIDSMRKVGHKIRCVYLEDYDMEMGKLIVAGVDLWLNTPTRPQEASGTSGMKAALNGVPQLSVLDGWWLEGHIEHVTGWSIGPHPEKGSRGDNDAEDTEDMYSKLECVIIPCFEYEREEWTRVMRQAIAINGSFFNSHRMVEQYVLSSYFS